MALPRIPISGRLVADPELRFTNDGKPVASFRVVASDRRPNRETGKWEDSGNPLWQQCTAFGQLAENIAESLTKGDQVIVFGKLETQEWTNQAGEKQSRQRLICDDVGASLVFRSFPHRATQEQRAREQGQGAQPGQTTRERPSAPAPDSDPWATQQPQQPAQGGGGAPQGGGYPDEPPF